MNKSHIGCESHFWQIHWFRGRLFRIRGQIWKLHLRFLQPFLRNVQFSGLFYKNKTVKKQTHLIFLFEYVDLRIDFYLTYE